ALSALAAHRSRLRVHRDFSVIALVANWSEKEEWRKRESAKKLLQGAEARARVLGYSLQYFWAREQGVTSRRFADILINRGIRGLILAPFENPTERFDLPWDQFSVVSIERPFHYTNFNHVVPNYYADMLLAWEKLWEFGYRRIGLVLDADLANRVAHQWEAAHSFEQTRRGNGELSVPILIMEEGMSSKNILVWLKTHKPEVVISRSENVYHEMLSLGYKVPEEIGYVSLNIVDDVPGVSGIYQLRDIMGEVAVDMLNSLMLVSHRGPVKASIGAQVDGVWRNGKTVFTEFKSPKA
ncbi:MAG: hypothetical protein KJT03_12945, partial [Verrucomicrobiae bacterium]|nr:hypothetical protein [Verrucomicrobiae bacterium]